MQETENTHEGLADAKNVKYVFAIDQINATTDITIAVAAFWKITRATVMTRAAVLRIFIAYTREVWGDGVLF